MRKTITIRLGALRAIPELHDFVWYWEREKAEYVAATVLDARLCLGSPFHIPGWDLF